MLESKCPEVQVNEVHTASDTLENDSQSQSQTQHQHSLDFEEASIPAGNLQGTAPPHLAALNDIQILKEQIRHLQMQTKDALLDPQEAKAEVAPEQYETIQRMKECLRSHSHEWDFRDGLESYSTVDAIEKAIERVDLRIYHKTYAGAHLSVGDTHQADWNLRKIYYSDEEEDDEDDEEEQQLSEKLMVKRREYLKSMEYKIEAISEELMKIRLAKKLRKKKKAADMERAAEMRAAEMRAAEMGAAEISAAIVQEQGASNEPSSSPETLQYALAKVNAVDWSSFKTLGSMKESESCVIDVLIGEPVTEDVFAGQFNWTNNWNNRTRTAPQPQKPNPIVLSGPRGQVPLPERIRIHSKLFLKILAQLLDSDGSEIDFRAPSIVFLRPFKVIAHHANRLRDWLKRLEEDINSPPALYGPATEEGAINPTMDASELDSPIAMEHLKCILDFIDSYITAKTAHLQNVECRKAYFSDLWYLYRPGIEVIGIDDKQAYRVIQVSSRRHRPASRKSPYYNYQFARKNDDESEKSDFTITCVYIDFDGKFIGPVLRTFEIKRFDGERDITTFEVYPLRLHKLNRSNFNEEEWSKLKTYPEQDRCRKSLINRGAKFVAVAAVKHMYYSGPTMVVREEVESQVVVDFETAFATKDELQEHIKRPSLENFIGETIDGKDAEESSDQICACCRFDVVYNDDTFVDKNQRTEYINGLMSKRLAEEQEHPPVALFPRLFSEIQIGSTNKPAFPDEELVIMSHRVFGFVLRSRKWAQLDLTHLTEVRESDLPISSDEKTEENIDNSGQQNLFGGKDTAFGRLVLENGHKKMIVSLITQHFEDKKAKGAQTEQVDIIRGKGKGLILLLHGAPGVGKTSTAEGVAELFRKPLFQITCGDLGVTARDVEKTLETNFNLATKWGCILLLDEADVFLAQRDKEDFVRNGLVAAFLRVLEYYAGILFLTTNRIGDFDEAFTSRIHMSLYYPELNRDKTLEIFDLNLKLIQDRFKRTGRAINIDYGSIKRFADMHFWYYHDSRWNGRQVRNACQTALALAEYQAQGGSNTKERDPKATVNLTVDDFEIVRDAYLEFTTYLSDLYGANTAHLAEERYLRAKGSFDEERDLPLTTEQLYKKYNKEMSQRAKRVPRQQQSDTGMNRRENYLETQQNRSGQQPRYSTSKRGQNQAGVSSSSKAHQPRSLLQPQKSAQPQPPTQQQYFSQPSDMEGGSITGFSNTGPRRREQRDQRQRQQVEDFQEDDDEYSEMQQQQQELDEMSYDEQEGDNGYDSLREQSIPVYTTSKSGQAARRFDGRRR